MPRAYVPNDVREAIGVVQDYLSHCRDQETNNLLTSKGGYTQFGYWESLANDRARYYRQNAKQVRELLSL